MKDKNEALRKDSGYQEYDTSDWLTGFLYELMRDAASVGEVERLVRHIEEVNFKEQKTLYTNGYLARYAKHLSKRIKKATS